MLKNLFTSLATCLLLASVFAADPCWTAFDNCGSKPACEDGSGQFAGPCYHTYCDRQSTCQNTSCYNATFIKRKMKSERVVLFEMEGQPPITSYCVLGPTYSPTGSCCGCGKPSVDCQEQTGGD